MTTQFSPRKSSSFRDDCLLCRIHEKELDMKTKMMEAKFHVEKLKLQEKHDADVQKILERKNNEIEELKTLYRRKQHETEETIRKLGKKAWTLLRDYEVISKTKEDQTAELKKMCEQSMESLNNNWEKKASSMIEELEQNVCQLKQQLQESQIQTKEQLRIIDIRREYETKLKGLMPASLRQELEDIISSLKSQVNFLQKRLSILQEN
ncbi:centrosomal protein of 112 kDa-like isoform X1 [Nomascus leucogenys]|uniref:centrosomal protein of 112 kDa-like isoform X1 n=2 Tax=Nomascus leucogenys TaxID=61853 RepID=UPI00122D5685|nr:centrosomal protein of 112 kDa-like isoform X1 [Nomascus leucogenys]